MGIICPCGVSVNALSKKNNVKFEGKCGTVKGNLTYCAEICVTTPGKSTLSLAFVDIQCPYVNNFLFKANAITSVTCIKDGQNCVVTVKGTGIVKGVERSFVAVFKDRSASTEHHIVQSFVITGFFDQNGAASVTRGSIIAVGCRER